MQKQPYTQKLGKRLGKDPLKLKDIFNELSLCLPNLIANNHTFQTNNSDNKKIQVKRQEKRDYKFRNLILFLFITSIIVFIHDVKKEMTSQITTWNIIREECLNDYIDNQCINPVQALKEKCLQYKICYSLEAEHRIMVSEIVAKRLGLFFNKFIQHSEILGAFLFLALTAIFLIFALKINHSRQNQMKYNNEG